MNMKLCGLFFRKFKNLFITVVTINLVPRVTGVLLETMVTMVNFCKVHMDIYGLRWREFVSKINK